MACVRSTTPTLAQEQLQMLLIILKLDQDVIKRTVMRIMFDCILGEAFCIYHVMLL